MAGDEELSLESAIDCAMAAYAMGDFAKANALCEQILAADPGNAQAALVALWIARRALDDGALFLAATGRLVDHPDAWSAVPRFPRPERAPVALVPGLERFYGGQPEVGDISDHLPALYHETVAARPRLIVELGTRGGESTRTFLAAAVRTGARMLSVDIDPCTVPGLPEEARRLWTFVQSDDIAFGEQRFTGWCRDNGLAPEIDVLFIDTSHLYEHTVAELRVWLPYLAPRGVAIFHDTNLDHVCERYDGAFHVGWNNERGVIRAIEDLVGRPLDERRPFVAEAGGWLIGHTPTCNGLTTMRRVP